MSLPIHRRTRPHRHLRVGGTRVSVAAALALAIVVGARDAVATNYTFSNPNGGAINVSTNFTPVGIPGSADTLVIDDLPRIFTNTTLTVPTNQAIAGIQYSHYGQTSINGPGTLTLQNGTIAFDDAITEVPGAPLTSLFINAPITSSVALTKTGRGFALIAGLNTSNGLSITGPGGIAVSVDTSLGAAGTAVTLNGGGSLRAFSSFTTTRALNITGGSSGQLESYGNLVWNGPVTGFGSSLTIAGSSNASTTLGGNVSNSGGVYVEGGTTLTLTGTIASSSVIVRGTLNLGSSTTGPAVNALSSSATVASDGGTIRMFARSTDTLVSTGRLLMANGGTTNLELSPNVNAGTQLNFDAIDRGIFRSTLFVRGRDLGSASLGPNRAVLSSNTAPAMIGGGGTAGTNASIVPWMAGNANVTGGVSQASVVDAGLVTYGVNGIRPLSSSEYATNFGGNATNNVRISDGMLTQSNAATANAVVIRDTMTSLGQSGITGTGTLTITSGAIVAVSDLSGDEMFIDNPINFGNAEGIVHVLPTADGSSTLTLNGSISGGSGGLTKSSTGDLLLANPGSTYAGVTTVVAGRLIFSGNVPASGASALGTSAIRVGAGVNDNRFTELLAATPDAIIARPITIGRLDTPSGRAVLGSFGGAGVTFAGNITLNGSLGLRGGVASDAPLVISGTILGNTSGAGGLSDVDEASPQLQYIRLTGGNVYVDGTIIRASQWQAGSNSAFGTGTIFFAGNNTTAPTGGISTFGGARSIANALVLRDAPVFTGADALTFTGPVDLGSVNREVFATNTTADTTFSGVVSRGGVIKRGDGRLVMSGANTYNGQTIVFEGTLRASSNNALGVAAGNANPNQGTFIIGNGSLELAGGITTAEAIYLGSGAVPITAANPLGNLRSVSGSNVITEAIAFDNVGTVGVDAGSTLTLTGDTLDNTVNTTATLRKVGAGTLAVKNVRLSAIDVQAGTLRITPAVSPNNTSRTSLINVAAGGLLDLSNSTLIYDYAGTSPLTSVRTLLQQGRIDTTSGGVNGAVGYAEAATLFPVGTTFPAQYAGDTVDNTTLLLIYTVAGDATLNKTVDFEDLLILARNFNGPNKVWMQGDFNYDATVNFDDLLLLAKAFNQTAPAASEAMALALADHSFAAEWSLAQSLVPEPTTLAAVVMLMPLGRRRR